MIPQNDSEQPLITSAQYQNEILQNQSSQRLQYSMNQSFQPFVENVDSKEPLVTNIADIDHPDKIIHLLQQTFQSGQIYIDQGYQNLISLNPFEVTQHLSDQSIQNHKKEYLKLSKNIYQIEQVIHNQVCLNLISINWQKACFSPSNIYNTCSILTQGISGSGKTVSAKGILDYVAALSTSGLFTSTTLNKVEIEKRVIAADVIFEAFGNAKTIKNSNSSRFGKVVSIQFEKSKKLSSAKIVTTLFERTRLTQKGFKDRNFHIFYELYTAYHKTEDIKTFANEHEEDIEFKYDLDELINEIEKLALDTEFMLLGTQNQFVSSQDNQSNKLDEDQAQANEDFGKFMRLLQAFGDLDFTLEEVVNIFQCIAGLIHLKEDNYEKAEELLKIPNIKQIIDKNIETRSSRKFQAESIINGIIMDFYYKLFMWIQNRVNSNISQDFDANKKFVLNIFDSFGFEIFENQDKVQQNQFEQLLLNYINEKLQNLFYSQIVENAQKKFQSEDINILPIDFQKNDRIVLAIEDVMFKSLKDSILLQRGTENYKDTVKKNIQEKGFQDILIDESQLKKKQGSLTQSQITHKFQQNIIGIRHTGGEIYYQLDGFLSSNKYMVSQEIQNLNQLSQNQIIKAFTQQSQSQTVVDTTQKEINDIIQMFKKSETWFVKCIQTNYQYNPKEFNEGQVKEQLSFSGIDLCANMLFSTYFLSIPKEEFFNTYLKLNPQSQSLGHLVDFINAKIKQSKDQTAIQPLLIGSNNILIKEFVKRRLDSELQQILSREQQQQYNAPSSLRDELIETLQAQLQSQASEIHSALNRKDEIIQGLNQKILELQQQNNDLIKQSQAIFKFINEAEKKFNQLQINNNQSQLHQPLQSQQEQGSLEGRQSIQFGQIN